MYQQVQTGICVIGNSCGRYWQLHNAEEGVIRTCGHRNHLWVGAYALSVTLMVRWNVPFSRLKALRGCVGQVSAAVAYLVLCWYAPALCTWPHTLEVGPPIGKSF
jgi:hypothetical protein